MADLFNTLTKLFVGFKAPDAEPAAIVTKLKAEVTAAEAKKLVDDFASCYQDKKAIGKDNYSAAGDCYNKYVDMAKSSPVDDKKAPLVKHDNLEKGDGIVKLRDYIKAKRGDDDKPITPNDVLQKEIGDFEKFYQEWRPSVHADEIKEFDEEFESLKKIGLSRDTTPSYPNLYQYTVLGNGALTFGWKFYTWVAEDPPAWDLVLPLAPTTTLMTSRFTGKSPTPISPFEYKQKSLWDTTSEAVNMGISLLPVGKGIPSSDYTSLPNFIGGFDLPNDTYHWVADQQMQKWKAENQEVTARNRLDTADKPIFGGNYKFVDVTLKVSLDTAILINSSNQIQKYSDRIDRSDQLSVGDGSQCTSASAAEIKVYRLKNPDTTKTDDEILRELCDNKPLGSNEALYAPKRANDLLTENNYIDAYTLVAFNRNISLMSNGEIAGPVSALGLALLQPVINQLPTIKDGINKSQLGHDYAFELSAGVLTLLSFNHPESRVALARTFDLWTDAFLTPKAYLRVSAFMNRDEPDNKAFGIAPGTLSDLIALDMVGSGFKHYFSGVEAGDMFARALKTDNTIDKLQLMSSLILGIGALTTRKIYLATLLKPKYADKLSDIAIASEVAGPILYVGGVVAGALTSDHQNDETTAFGMGVNGGMLGGNILGANDKPLVKWGLNLGLGNATLGGSF